MKIYDPPLTLKIVNKIINYDFEHDYRIERFSHISEWRKNGYLAYDKNNEELGIIFEDDNPDNPYYKCAHILYFKKYRTKHNLGIWRIIRPIYSHYTLHKNKYILFENLETILENDSVTITTKATYHSNN